MSEDNQVNRRSSERRTKRKIRRNWRSRTRWRKRRRKKCMLEKTWRRKDIRWRKRMKYGGVDEEEVRDYDYLMKKEEDGGKSRR